MVSGWEQKLKLQQVYWSGVVGFGVIALAYLLAVDWLLLALPVAAFTWAMLLPFHTQIAVFLSVATFSSALIVPFFPGRPFLWEFAALLAWSGLVITISLRRYSPDFGATIRAHRWLFIALAGYCVVLVVTMFYRGFGLRILGSQQMGGRFYFQQLACAIFPVLFAACRLDEKTLRRLVLWQCLLTITYVVSDFAFAFGAEKLLYFFEVPGDAANFEFQSRGFGLRRFQSLGIIGQGLFFAILIGFNLRDFFSRKWVFLIPAALGVFAVGLYSGHRWVIVIVGLTLLFCAWSQRFFNLRNTVLAGAATVGLLVFAYSFAGDLPLTVQRAISDLPGIGVEHQARSDGAATMETRRLLRRAGVEAIPEYFWIGRGFGLAAALDYSPLWDPSWVTWHINQGKFYNGFIGLMVNTGVFGTAFMALFIFSGTVLALQVMRHLRRHGCQDGFARVCSLVAGLWMANAMAFVFINGDSEYAMKTFSLQAGILLACKHLLAQRLRHPPKPA